MDVRQFFIGCSGIGIVVLTVTVLIYVVSGLSKAVSEIPVPQETSAPAYPDVKDVEDLSTLGGLDTIGTQMQSVSSRTTLLEDRVRAIEGRLGIYYRPGDIGESIGESVLEQNTIGEDGGQ